MNISRPLPAWTKFQQRLRTSIRTLFARGDFTALVIGSLLMLLPVLALNSSLGLSQEPVRPGQAAISWGVSLAQLIPIAILSVWFGFLLARSHYSELTALMLTGVYNVGTIALIQLVAAPGDPIHRVYNVALRFITSINNGLAHTGSFDPYLLVIFLSILIWFLGHNTAWHIFRLDRVWRAILPPGIVLLLNNFYNVQQSNLDAYLGIYLFLSLLLIIRSHIEAREFDWYTNRVAFKSNLRIWFFRGGALLAALALLIAYLIPTGQSEENAKRFQQFLNQDTPNKVMESINKLFSPLESKGVATADYYGGEKLTLGGDIQLGEQPVMIVQAPAGPARYYWKSRIFDTYLNGEWTAQRESLVEDTSSALVIQYPDATNNPALRQNVGQTYTMLVDSSRLVYAAPQPVTIHMPIEMETDRLKDTGAYDVAVIRPTTQLKKGNQYSVVSSVVTASASYLRTTSTTYPQWVLAKNLQLPPNLSSRVTTLANQIVSDARATTPYDKAKAIETWLRTNIRYNARPKMPPAGQDIVDYMLSPAGGEGYCTYYASGMILMLRYLGIPSRMGAGFAQGLRDDATGQFTVKERDAHTWVEVYFPGVGWVEFEPTANQPVVNRQDPQSAAPTPTPSPTPTLPPTATPKNSSGPKPPDNLTQTPATFTPTAAGSNPPPTSTPPPAAQPPTAQPPTQSPSLSFLSLPPPVQNFLSFLLLLAAIVAVISFGVAAFIWWVDYRGLDRLSPVGRAYARLEIYANWLGIRLDRAHTPLERGRRIVREVPTGGRPISDIADAYTTERYAAPRSITLTDEKQAEESWRKARRAFVTRKINVWLRRSDKKDSPAT